MYYFVKHTFHRDVFCILYITNIEPKGIDFSPGEKIVLFDEIDAALDREGSDLLHATLKTCSAENIFLVSHKADLLADRVDFIINFQIKNNFTIIS